MRRLEPDAAPLAREIASRWDTMCRVESLFDAIGRGDVDRLSALWTSPLGAALDADPIGQVDLLAHAANAGPLPLRDWVEARVRSRPELVHVRGVIGGTLLHDAARSWNTGFAALLIELGADVNARCVFGHTSLYHAANRYLEPRQRTPDDGAALVHLLASHGADVDATGGVKGTTPLHMAARRGNAGIARALLAHGATLEARDSLGETPLRRAVNCGQVEIVEMLLQAGADPHTRDSKGRTPLQAARNPLIADLLRRHAAV